jgi:hypothetical protein
MLQRHLTSHHRLAGYLKQTGVDQSGTRWPMLLASSTNHVVTNRTDWERQNSLPEKKKMKKKGEKERKKHVQHYPPNQISLQFKTRETGSVYALIQMSDAFQGCMPG